MCRSNRSSRPRQSFPAASITSGEFRDATAADVCRAERFWKKHFEVPPASRLGFTSGRLDFGRVSVDSYLASAAGDFLRQKLLAQRSTFTFETVMSHPGKVDLLKQAKAAGYRTYLYFVATDDPAINISRVRNRVKLGGHPVPEDRIEKRYHRSLELLMEAIRHTNRAYVFDNSGDNADRKHSWLAEITDGRRLELKTDRIPSWFRRVVLEKFNATPA